MGEGEDCLIHRCEEHNELGDAGQAASLLLTAKRGGCVPSLNPPSGASKHHRLP